MNAGLGKIQAHCELFSEKNIKKRRGERGREKRQRDRKKKIQGYRPPFGSNVELLFCPLPLFTVNNRRPK